MSNKQNLVTAEHLTKRNKKTIYSFIYVNKPIKKHKNYETMKNNENAATSNEKTSSSSNTSSSAKEKKSVGSGGGVGWFHSLTRRKKSQSQLSLENSLAANNCTQENASGSASMSTNNNNESPPPSTVPMLVRSCNGTLETSLAHNCDSAAGNCSCNPMNNSRKRKEEKNAFQRFRKKMGIRFPSLRRRKASGEDENSATTDASAEFLTQSPVHEPLQFNFQHIHNSDLASGGMPGEDHMTPFTHDFERFIKKKWLYRHDPNLIMYQASCEMLR